MRNLTHYIIVRRDLPFGVTLAMVAHAAGESFYALHPRSSKVEHPGSNREVGGSSPSEGSPFDPSNTVAVVLGARNEARLKRAARLIYDAGIAAVSIVETDGHFAGQLMAIGVVPGDREKIYPVVREYQMFLERE